jgi:ribosomal protein L20A (L18A)
LLLTGNVPVLNLTIMGYDLQKLINLRNFFSDIGDKNNVSMMNIYIEQFRNIEREALALEYVN